MADVLKNKLYLISSVNCFDHRCMRVCVVHKNICIFISNKQLYYSKDQKKYFFWVHMNAVFKKNNNVFHWISINVKCSKITWLRNSNRCQAVIFGHSAGKITIRSVINILMLKCVENTIRNTFELRDWLPTLDF